MDKKLAGLVGALAGMATIGAANATQVEPTVSRIPDASSYAELLATVPNAAEVLRADELARTEDSATLPAGAQIAQYHHHHHHHHHQRVIIRRHHHHHHHTIVIKRRGHHHHHHHHYD